MMNYFLWSESDNTPVYAIASSLFVCCKNVFVLFMLSDYQRKQTARGRTKVLFYVFLHVYCLRLAWNLLSERKSIALTLLHYRK